MKHLFLILAFLVSFSAFSQSNNWQFTKLDKQFEDLAYQKVILNGIILLKKGNSLTKEQEKEVIKKLAYASYYTKDYALAETYFSKSSALVTDVFEEADVLIKYAQVLAGIGKHAAASAVWKRLSDSKNQRSASSFALLQSNTEPLTRNSQSYKISYLPLNSSFSDFSPSFYKNGLVFVSSRPKNSPIKRVFAWDDSPFLDLYFLNNKNNLKESSLAASSADSPKKRKRRLGSDFYTSATANDGHTLGYRNTSEYLENPSLTAARLSRGLNSVYHEGPSDFFNEDQSIIFTRNGVKGFRYESADGVNRVHLFLADKKANDWTNLKAYPFNSAEYSTGHPTFISDENILFFVSDMPGGYGGTDIYFSKFENGRWYKPQNAGSKINTAGNEMFPYIDEANTLYFSSNGHPGLGGLDIFSIQLTNNGRAAGTVHNFGAPINSTFDDFGMLTDASFTKGYFSSNRKRGGADDDIYSFIRTGDTYGCKDVILAVNSGEEKKSLLSLKFSYYNLSDPNVITYGNLDLNGIAKLCLSADSEFYFKFEDERYEQKRQFFSTKELSDFKETTFEVLLKAIKEEKPEPEKSEIRVLHREKDLSSINRYKGVIRGRKDNKPVSGVRLRFLNKCTSETQEFVTTASGAYSFKRDPACDYEFTAIRPGFASNYEFIPKTKSEVPPAFTKATIASLESQEKVEVTNPEKSFFDPKVFRVEDVVKLSTIYYETKNVEFSNSAESDLNHLLVALKAYPEMVIEVLSHTDSRGSARENQVLSQTRASQIKDYLSSKGVSPFRIKAVGMGERYPVNKCTEGIKCTEFEYRRNRRTEFNILQIERI